MINNPKAVQELFELSLKKASLGECRFRVRANAAVSPTIAAALNV
jgi:hypothetical protein